MKRTASYILVFLALHVLFAKAQVTAHVWKADTSWYNTQIGGFHPDRITPVISIVNEGSDTTYQVSLTCDAQSYLRFTDGSVSSTISITSQLAPGDSLRIPLHLQLQVGMYQTSIPWPQQLFWQLDWEQGSAREKRSNEGHAIALLSGNCPAGDGKDELQGLDIVMPDTLVLDPGPDGLQRRELEFHCLVYSRKGFPIVVDDVTFGNGDGQRIVPLEVHRLTPRDSIFGRVVAPGDTLRVRFKVFVPYMEWRQYAIFRASMAWRYRPDCGNISHRVERRQIMRLRHLPARMATGEMWVSFRNPDGVGVMLRTTAWCGEAPVGIDSAMLTLRDNGELITPEYFEPSIYHQARRPLRAMFVLDVTRSVGEAGLGAYRKAIRAWSRIMEAEHDSLAIITLAGDARQLLQWSADTARIDEALARLSLRDGHSVTGAAHALFDLDHGEGSESKRLLLFFSDGWYPSESFDIDSLKQSALRDGWIYHQKIVDTDINVDRLISWNTLSETAPDAVEMQKLYIDHSWQYELVQHSRFMYTLPCRLGVERDLALTLHGLCGADTTMHFSITVPDDSLVEPGTRFLLRDATVTAGGKLELPVGYENAWPQSYYTTEFSLRYDTTRLRFDSLVTRTVKYPPSHRVSSFPGMISVVSGFKTDRGMDDFAYACFSVLPVADTTQTAVSLVVWYSIGGCSILPSRDATVTIVPGTTDAAPAAAPEEFRLLSLYPQPATDRITLDLQLHIGEDCDYRISDLLGRERLRGRIPAGWPGRRLHSIPLPADIEDGHFILELRQGAATAIVQFLRRR